MANAVTSTGITTDSQSDLVTQYTADMQAIYGSDIVLTSDSPDGQMMMIWIQAVLDILDFIVAVFTSFDPDQAFGTVLDQRVAINGIQRQSATYTVTNVTITTTQSVNLYGLDQNVQPVFTVSDNAGNQWQLKTTQLGFSAPLGSALAFQAASPGSVLSTPNTITTPVTVVLGVSAINNPTTYSSLGEAEESDAALKIRRARSVALPSQGYFTGLLGGLENVTGVTSAEVIENNTNATDTNNIPAHSIWVIVGGSAADADVANVIYRQRGSGCGMYSVGDASSKLYNITQADGSIFQIIWDTVVGQNLYIGVTLASIDGVNIPNYATILSAIASAYQAVGVNTPVNINSLTTTIQSADSNALATFAAGQGFSLTQVGGYANTLTPTSKRNQFISDSTKISLLPIIMVAANGRIAIVGGVVTSTASVVHGGNTIQFSVQGGRGTMNYTMQSGLGSVNATTGLYTSAGTGTDVVKVTDADGNQAICTVTVT